jgi:catechol 2,3-dioxygenase-like lactoylglutathione lyase family enzyme
MHPSYALRFAEQWVAAWNRRDLDLLLAQYAEDAELTSPLIAEVTGDPRGRIRGKAAIVAYWREALGRFPDLHFELIDAFSVVDGLAIQYRSFRGSMACEVLTLDGEGFVIRAAHYAVRAEERDAEGPRVRGILETALTVADPSRSAGFYRRVFGLDILLETERLVALGVAGRDVLLLFREGSTSEPLAVSGGIIPPHGPSGPSHLAFAIAAADLDAWRARLAAEKVPVESVVTWPAGPKSLYFRDPDGHLLELITPGFWPVRMGRHPRDEEPSDGRFP